MSHSSITVNASLSAAAFVLSRLPHTYQAWQSADGPAGNPDGITDQLAKWKDHIDAAVNALHSAQLLGVSAAESADDTDFAISAGWDTGDTVVNNDSTNGSTVAQFHFAITAGATTTANPTVTFTFPTARTTAPRMAIPVQHNISAAVGGHWSVDSISTTAIVLQFVGTPEDSVTHTCRCLVVF